MLSLTTEAKVGLFVLLSLLLLIYMTATVGNWNLGRDRGYIVITRLDTAAGLLKDTPVKVLGVTQGKVEELEIEGGRAKVSLRLPSQLSLPEDSLVYLRAEGLLGENYIEIKPGTPGRSPVRDREELMQGAPPADIDRLISELEGVASGIQQLTRTINQPVNTLPAEGEQRGALESIISNLEATSASLKHLSRRIERGEGTLGKLLTDESLYRELKETLSGIGSAMETFSSGKGTLSKLFQDEELYDDIKVITTKLRTVIARMEQGEGIAGKLFIENRRYQDQTAVGKGASSDDDNSIPLTALGGILGKVTQ